VRCYFRDTFMQVVKADEQAEQRFLADKLEERRKAVREQYGLLFVIEALAGGSFAKEITAKLRLDEPMAAIMEAAEERLKARRPVLVGHNQFLDLCFLHQTFFGPLPPTLEAFEAEIHASFPRVADTKFMAERGRHEMAPDFNLRDLFLRAKGAATPVIVAALGTPGYPPGIDRSHSAGFDSTWPGRSAPLRCALLTLCRLDDGSIVCQEGLVASEGSGGDGVVFSGEKLPRQPPAPGALLLPQGPPPHERQLQQNRCRRQRLSPRR